MFVDFNHSQRSKLLLLILFLLSIISICNAQEIRIKEMSIAEQDLSARTNPKKDNNGIDCALLKVRIAREAKFEGLVQDAHEHTTSEYWVYMADGAKKIIVRVENYLPLEVEFSQFGIKSLEKLKTYILTLDLRTENLLANTSKVTNLRNRIYFDIGARYIGTIAVGGSMGGYYNQLNIEAGYYLGLSESETIYWTTSATSDKPKACTYKPTLIAPLRVGYGFAAGKRGILTPQLGVNFVKLSEQSDSSTPQDYANRANCLSAVIGLRTEIAVSRNLAIVISPEYSFLVSQSAGFSALSNLSSDIKTYGEGFVIKMGMSLSF